MLPPGPLPTIFFFLACGSCGCRGAALSVTAPRAHASGVVADDFSLGTFAVVFIFCFVFLKVRYRNQIKKPTTSLGPLSFRASSKMLHELAGSGNLFCGSCLAFSF